MKPFSLDQWIAWAVASFTAGVTMVVFAYANFEPRNEHQNIFNLIDKRLDRIENKIEKVQDDLQKALPKSRSENKKRNIRVVNFPT